MQLKKKARFTFKQSTIDENNKWLTDKLNKEKMAHARAMSPGYGKRREQVIEAVSQNPGMTRRELAKALGMDADKLTMLSKYVQSGRLRVRKQDGWLRWYPINYKFSDDPKPKEPVVEAAPEPEPEILTAIGFDDNFDDNNDPVIEEHPAFESLPEPEYVPETVAEVSQKLEKMLTPHTEWLEQKLKDYAWDDDKYADLAPLKAFLAYVKALDGDKS